MEANSVILGIYIHNDDLIMMGAKQSRSWENTCNHFQCTQGLGGSLAFCLLILHKGDNGVRLYYLLYKEVGRYRFG